MWSELQSVSCNCRDQALTRFDRWSLSAIAIFRQLPQPARNVQDDPNENDEKNHHRGKCHRALGTFDTGASGHWISIGCPVVLSVMAILRQSFLTAKRVFVCAGGRFFGTKLIRAALQA